MLKILPKKIFFLYFFLIIVFINCEDDYQINLDGEDCSHASYNPEIPEECTSYNTEETACCFVGIEGVDKKITNKCVEVPKDARFALNHLTIFTLKANDGSVYEDVIGKFQCGQEDKLCGMDIPEKIFQCSEHSSTTRSCCYLTTPTYTECVLSDKKYNEETVFKLFEESTVYCTGKLINRYSSFFILLFINVLFLI